MSSSPSLSQLQCRWQFPAEGYSLPGPGAKSRLIFVTKDGDLYENQQDSRYSLMAVLDGNHHSFSENPGDVKKGFEKLAEQPNTENYVQLARITSKGAFHPLLTCQNPPAAKPYAGPLLFLMDFGKVLCDFDYSWFAHSFRATFDKQPTADGLRLVERLRPQFEAGEWSSATFFDKVRVSFELKESDCSNFAKAWCGFLRLDPTMVTLVRQFLRRPQTQLRMVSNVDPWVVEHARTAFGLSDLFEDGVFSFLSQVNPKDMDASMWQLARQRGMKALGDPSAFSIAIDDTTPHLERVQQENAADACICFQNPAKWLFELSRHGIRLPIS